MKQKIEVTCPHCLSRIVHSAPLILKEKIIANFIPTEIYICQACSTRFVLHGSPLAYPETRKALALAGVFIFALFVAVFFLFLHSGSVGTNLHRQSAGTSPPGPTKPGLAEIPANTATNRVNTESPASTVTPSPTPGRTSQPIGELPQEQPPSPTPTTTISPLPGETTGTSGETGSETGLALEPTGYKIIHMGDDRKFGVNWEVNGQGLRITRISAGPLDRAGLRVGDVLVSLDRVPLSGEAELLEVRDKIIDGSLLEAVIEVSREKERIFYTLRK